MKIDNLTQRRSRAFQSLAQERDEAKAQRDELLSALMEIAEDKLRQGDAIWMRDVARAAIQKSKTRMNTKEEIIASLTTPRQDKLNAMRWETFLSLGIPIAGKTIFEPGAGIGDQTQWLLDHKAKYVFVNDGREGNLQVIKDRFSHDPRVATLLADLENNWLPACVFSDVDLIFCWGVYYHLRESFPAFPIMKRFASIGETIVLDYLEGDDTETFYGYDNPSTSLSQFAFRPRTETLMKALKYIWGYSYLPKKQLEWVDPVAPETRLIAVASHVSLDDNPNLIPQ